MPANAQPKDRLQQVGKEVRSVFPARFLLVVSLLVPAVSGQVNVQLVSARDHIEGSFTTSQSLWADRNHIFLGSSQGRLFILARQRRSNFPVIARIQVSSAALTAVRGDSDHIYVASADGALHVYQNKKPFYLVNTVPLSDFGLRSVALSATSKGQGGARLFVSKGQAALEAFGDRVYLSALNEGEIGLQLEPQTLSVTQSYGQTFAQSTTKAFDSQTGQQIGVIPNPLDLYGRLSQVSVYADASILVQTIPGCCGPGMVVREAGSLAIQQFIPRPSTNTVSRQGQWLIAGNENGSVEVFDLSQNPSPSVATANLRDLTVHTGMEDIEIRALWTDTSDNLIFAASSWGNDQARNPFLPSFFVLELLVPKP